LTLTDVIGPTDIEVTDVLTQCLSLDLTMDESPAQTHAAGDHGEHDHRGRTRADPRSDHACYEKAAAGHRTHRLGAESGQAALGVVERVLSCRGHLRHRTRGGIPASVSDITDITGIRSARGIVGLTTGIVGTVSGPALGLNVTHRLLGVVIGLI